MSDGNVVSVNGDPVVSSKPNLDVVRACEDLLEMAQSGEIQGITYCALHSDGTTTGYWRGISNRALIGAMATLQTVVIARQLEED